MSQADLPPDIFALPIAERVELVARIWDSIVDDAAPILADEDRKILDQRLADHQQHPEQGVSWEALKKELRDGQ